LRNVSGNAGLVRNGYLTEREILTGMEPSSGQGAARARAH